MIGRRSGGPAPALRQEATQEDGAVMTEPKILQVGGLSFAFGARPTLKDVNLSVSAGEIVGVVGPNGSGKTTLIRLICGVLRPQGGRILVSGDDVTKLPRSTLAKRVAVVPQSPLLPPSFTAGEIVLLGRTPHLRLLHAEGAHDLAVVKHAMEVTRTLEFADRRVGEISGGELQRVVLARALAQEPALLLLDEPTAHLDINHQTAILDLIAQLAREQKLAVLAVLHDLNLASQYCQRLVFLHDGHVVADGPPAEVLNAENVSLAYGTEVCIVSHPHNQLPVALVTGKSNGQGGYRE